MKYHLLISLIIYSCLQVTTLFAKLNPEQQQTVDSILQEIKEPVISDYNINITDFKGKGDGKTDNKPAFDNAIKQLEKKGGGNLIVPEGDYYLAGPIHLTSNMILHLEKGARLFFSSEPADYLPVVKTSWEGTFLNNYSPFIYAYQCINVGITGEGVIDGEAAETWNTWKPKQKADQLLSRKMNHENTTLEERNFGKGHYLRPQLVQFFDCKNVLVEGVRLEDSPFWCLHLLRCENVIIRGISYDAHNKNNDGIDPEYSRNVLIDNVTFNNADDNVAIKAGRDTEGRALEIISENIVIRNCHFKGLHAVVVGSEMSAGVKNVFVYDCDYAGDLKRGIYLKSNPDRGGYMKNIYVRDVDFGKVEDFIYITSYYHNEGEGHTTEIKDVYFENITCKEATGSAIVIQGYPEKKISEVYFKNIKVETAKNAISMSATENIVFSDVTIGETVGAPSYVK